MKMVKKELWLVVVAVAIGGMVYWAGRPDDAPVTATALSTRTAPAPAMVPVMKSPVQAPSAPPVVQAPRTTVAAPIVDQSQPAEISMAAARENGDSRTPPIIHREPEMMEAPTAAERADPKLYAQYEQRQADKGYAAYVSAANDEIPKLQQELEKAKEMGIPPEQLAVGEEKLRRITEMRDQLLSQHPEIARQ